MTIQFTKEEYEFLKSIFQSNLQIPINYSELASAIRKKLIHGGDQEEKVSA